MGVCGELGLLLLLPLLALVGPAAALAGYIETVLSWLHHYAASFQSLPLDRPIHPFQIGDQVLIRKWKHDPLTPQWEGPHTVSLISHAAVKLHGSDKWTHHTRVKQFHTPDNGAKPLKEDYSPLSTLAPEDRGGTGEASDNWINPLSTSAPEA